MPYLKSFVQECQKSNKFIKKIKMRKHLNADSLYAAIRSGLANIEDHRQGNVQIPLADAIMSGFAMFSLKDPSLLAFDGRRHWGAHNLMTTYGIKQIPCDTSMREILDGLDPVNLRPFFNMIFRKIQRGKALEKMVFMDGSYLLNLDGTGYFSSAKRHSPDCMEKVDSKTGEVFNYYLQVLGAAIVHPDYKEVIPLCPEPIKKQDGETKNDCERNATKRFLEDLSREHPHLKLIINEDALSSNAPHLEDLEKYNHHYIIGVKEGDHKYLFQHINEADKNISGKEKHS